MRPVVIAEIGCNHMGDIETAKEMIRTASVFCGVTAVKFQKRCAKELLTEEEYNAPHPVTENSYGRTYGEHRENLEFDLAQHEELMAYCKKQRIGYSCSVWDTTSAKEITSLNPEMIKIPSACNLDWKLMEYILSEYEGEIHISLGMTSVAEESQIVDTIKEHKRQADIVLYACTSGYPVPLDQCCLLEIYRLRKAFAKYGFQRFGFSGHHLGIAIDVAAYALGARYIERHFTLDRALKGTDHAASVEPDGLRRLMRNLIATEEALKLKRDDILPIEIPQRKKLKRGVEM